MNTMMHLTEDQIDDVLMGDPAAESAAHLEACSTCRLRVVEFEVSLAGFKAVTLAWSERRSATAPAKLRMPVNAAWQRGASWAAAAAVLLVGIAVPVARHETRGVQVVASNTVSRVERGVAAQTAVATTARVRETVPAAPGLAASGKSAAQIARDNEMLQAIDRELDASVQSPTDAFGPVATGGASAGQGRFAPVDYFD